MRQLYDRAFFDWVRLTSLRSARLVLPAVLRATRPASVVDVGCGEGAWLSVWHALGVTDGVGVDGAYVDRAALMIPDSAFVAADLSAPLRLPRRFDLVQSLEVAEHLRPDSSDTFVASLCALGDVVLFSAARPGQGGEGHINERQPSAWAALFARHGYAPFDCIRPALAGADEVAPWYRFNTVVFANRAGQRRLSAAALDTGCLDPLALDAAEDWRWRLRLIVLRPLPVGAVTALSRLRYRIMCTLPRRREESALTTARG